ncbi:MAG: recombination protein RecR [Firmicutes bacterium]|nr:recombination protein RecR [Bacillota bacterium]
MNYPVYLEKLINYYKKLPGIGEKSAERLAIATLDFNSDEIEEFSDTLVNAKNKLGRCAICGHITDEEICDICRDETRNKSVICVIEDYKSVFSFEKSGKFNGNYHVLNGLISPMDDIGPEDINLASLIMRVESLDEPELILALKPTIEGEATTLYIKKILENKKATISRLSYGIPIGAEIDYLDNVTLEKALEDRKKIS